MSNSWRQRCKAMFNNEILSDVKFVVKSPQKYGERDSKGSKITQMEIPAHKFLLSISSPVFFAMFCGEMAETKEHIHLPDCEYEGMLELLSYIYTDVVFFNGNNVMQVLYLAEKYMIPSLTSECTEFLRENLDISNVFCVFKHAEQYGKEDLLYHCWDMIDKNTLEALKSNEFLNMDRSFLNQLVERNSLNIKEVELFKAVDCWANEECKSQQLTANGPVKRHILGGKIVKNIRFPVMKQRDFEDVVLPCNILTRDEKRKLMTYFNSTSTSPIGFMEVPRVGTLLRCCSFKSFLPCTYHVNDPKKAERNWMQFNVDRDILLHGVSVLGNDGGNYMVDLEVYMFDDDENELVPVTKTGTYTSRRRACENGFYYGFDVVFDEPCVIEAGDAYAIGAFLTGPGRCLGKEEIDEVSHSGVKINFEYDDIITDPIHGDLFKNPFAEILFQVKE